MASTLIDCTTLAVLRTLGFVSSEKQKNEHAMEAGKAVHKAGELWLGGYPSEPCLAKLREVYEPYSNQYLTVDDRLYHDNIRDILSYVYSQAPLNSMPFTVEEILTEKQFVAEIVKGVKWTTKPDGVVRLKDTGDLYVFELKTTGGKLDTTKYLMDGQVTAHVEVMRMNGFDVQGVVLMGIQLNKLPAPIKNKCKTHHIPQYDCRNTHVDWKKFILMRTPAQIQQWKDTATELGARYAVALSYIQELGFDEGIKRIAMEGQFHDKCSSCFSREFCNNGKQAHDFVIREREEGIIHSGLDN